MKYRWLVWVCVLASSAAAQSNLGSYLGPGILTRGVGDIGTKSGEQVDLRFYAGVNGTYDNGLQPLKVDAQGNLVRLPAVYGVEAAFGAYGVHNWKRAQMGLNYTGNFHHYMDLSGYDGSDHALALGYTFQKSARLNFDLRETVGTYSRAFGSVAATAASDHGAVDPGSQFFDSRTNYLSSSVFVTFLQSARTSYSLGGSGYLSYRQERNLADSRGYTLTGRATRRLSPATSVGVVYSFGQQEMPNFSSSTDIQTVEGTFAQLLGQKFTLTLEAGIFRAHTQSVVAVQLDPSLARVFGVPSLLIPFERNSIYPSGTASLSKAFRRVSLSISYHRGASTGNGIYQSSRVQEASAGISYSGIRKWNFGISGSYSSSSDLSHNLGRSTQFNGGAGVTYALTNVIHVSARYDSRRMEVDASGYGHSSSSATVGLVFSPGNIPLSLW